MYVYVLTLIKVTKVYNIRYILNIKTLNKEQYITQIKYNYIHLLREVNRSHMTRFHSLSGVHACRVGGCPIAE